MWFDPRKLTMPAPGQALPGRQERMPVPPRHFVLGTPLDGPWPEGHELALFGMGCFWGAERKFWQLPGVWSTSVGYAGGPTPNPTYEEVCTGRTGHAEVVRVVYDPSKVSFHDLLRLFWENHDPTSGYRQGNDIGTQYRSTVYWTTPAQRDEVERTAAQFAPLLDAAGWGAITTEVAPAPAYYYAEDYHQQYLYKVPNGYDCHSATGLHLPD